MAQSQLQASLEALLGSDRVYFQPPSNITMQYPCIVYAIDQAVTDYGDNYPYRYTKRYEVMVISREPNSAICDSVAMLSTSQFNRAYTADNLHHTVFLLYG